MRDVSDTLSHRYWLSVAAVEATQKFHAEPTSVVIAKVPRGTSHSARVLCRHDDEFILARCFSHHTQPLLDVLLSDAESLDDFRYLFTTHYTQSDRRLIT